MMLLEVRGECIDLDRLKARDRNIQIFECEKFGKRFEFDRQLFAVPASVLRDLVVSEKQRSLPCFG